MRTMGAGCGGSLSSSWRSTERQEESGGGRGGCNWATPLSPKIAARLGPPRRDPVHAPPKAFALSETALAGAALLRLVGIPVRPPAWPLLLVDSERAAFAVEGKGGHPVEPGQPGGFLG